jgi:hypothetical protein
VFSFDSKTGEASFCDDVRGRIKKADAPKLGNIEWVGRVMIDEIRHRQAKSVSRGASDFGQMSDFL